MNGILESWNLEIAIPESKIQNPKSKMEKGCLSAAFLVVPVNGESCRTRTCDPKITYHTGSHQPNAMRTL